MNTDRIQRLQSLLDRIKHNAGKPKQLLGKEFVFSGTAAPRSDVSTGPSLPAGQQSRTPTRTDMPIERGPQQPLAVQPVQPAPVPQMRSLKMTQPMQLSPSVQPTPTSPAVAPTPHQTRVEQTPVSGRAAPIPAAPAARPPAPSAPQAAPPPPAQQAQPAPSAPAHPAPAAPAHAPPAAAHAQSPTTTGTSSANMQAVHAPLVAVPSVSATMVDGRRVRARVPTVIGVAPSPGGAKIEPPPAPPQRDRAPSVTIEEVDADDVLDAVSSLPPPPEPKAAEAQPAERATDDTRASQADVDNLTWSEPPIEVELPPPDSSRRPRVAGSIDEALADATAESDVEVPVKTPPPESGRQPAEGVYAAPMQAPGVPTAEQLGDTVELEEPTAAELELDLSHRKVERATEELEVELPKQPSELEPLSAPELPHRARESSQVVEIPEEADTAILPGSSRRALVESDELRLQPQVTQRRSAAEAGAIEVLRSARAFAPRSFLELLDASLKLGGK